jgi:hypothetical protein
VWGLNQLALQEMDNTAADVHTCMSEAPAVRMQSSETEEERDYAHVETESVVVEKPRPVEVGVGVGRRPVWVGVGRRQPVWVGVEATMGAGAGLTTA